MKILAVEDNLILARNLVRFLSLKDISCDLSMDGEDWLLKASLNFYDAIILDINLPKLSGLEILEKLREKWKNTPIIMLTSNSQKSDIVNWLELWADDYLTKPFDYEELLARINSLTRRNLKNKSTKNIKISDLEIDLELREVKKDWKEIKFSKTEFDLLKYLVQNKWKVCSRRELYEHVWWEFDWDFMFSKTIDVYIWYLRKKLWRELIETKKAYWFLIN